MTVTTRPDTTALLWALLEGLPDEVALVDRQGVLLFANEAFRTRHRLGAPHEILGRPVGDLLPDHEARTLQAATRNTLERGLPSTAEQPRDAPQNDPATESWQTHDTIPIRDPGGQTVVALHVGRDITRWKRLEQDLRDSEALYHALVEQLPMHVFRKDRQGRFVFANGRLCQTLGITRQEILGKTDHDFAPRPLADKYRQDDQRIMSTGEMLRDVEEHLPRDGEPTYVQVFKTPVHNARGELLGTQGFFIDITQLKRTEAALVKQTAELETALHALKAKQEQLLLADKMASLGRLTAGIAHEMNTPLAAVRSALAELDSLAAEYQEAIGDGEVAPEDHREIAEEMRKTIKLAATAARRAAGFVQGIKSQTRDLAPRERIRFDAVAVVEEALLLVSHAVRHASCELRFEPARTSIDIHGAPGRLAQIVTNLVKNAVDASTGKGGGTVRVRIGPVDGGAVLLEIEDSGSGMPPDLLAKIFDPMFTTKPFGEGTGLGLTIVHDIVVGDFGGNIDVTTELGRGTTFLVRFPPPGGEVRDAP